MKLFLTPLMVSLLMLNSFKDEQLKHSRVKDAYSEKEAVVKAYFTSKNLNYDGYHLFIRGFKQEKDLEVWIREKGKTQYRLLTTYDFCATSGLLGPKRRLNDGQIPEGVYQINHFNPLSNYHLSLGINYPNKSDLHFADKNHPGGNIYIHGNCVTIGCIPITDDKIKELYILAVEARNNGQRQIPVHIFPARLTNEKLAQLKSVIKYKETQELWDNLAEVYADFNKENKLHAITVSGEGRYIVSGTYY